jgi:zinc transport system permease protein
MANPVRRASTFITMAEIFEALSSPFFRAAFLAGLIASVSFGIVGSYVVTKRITAIAGAIAHCALGGIGLALYAQRVLGWAWCDPMLGALVFAVGSAMVIGVISLKQSEREDTVIGALWAAGMAIGILAIKKIPGFVRLDSWLFGDMTIVTMRDVWMISGLGLVIVILALLFHSRFVAVCFDEEFARVRGIPVPFYYLLLLCMTAVTVVLLVRVVGIIMVIALVTLPAAVASQFARQLWQMMRLAILFCAFFVVTGLGLSIHWNTVSGPAVILVATAVYLIVLIWKRVIRR